MIRVVGPEDVWYAEQAVVLEVEQAVHSERGRADGRSRGGRRHLGSRLIEQAVDFEVE